MNRQTKVRQAETDQKQRCREGEMNRQTRVRQTETDHKKGNTEGQRSKHGWADTSNSNSKHVLFQGQQFWFIQTQQLVPCWSLNAQKENPQKNWYQQRAYNRSWKTTVKELATTSKQSRLNGTWRAHTTHAWFAQDGGDVSDGHCQ